MDPYLHDPETLQQKDEAVTTRCFQLLIYRCQVAFSVCRPAWHVEACSSNPPLDCGVPIKYGRIVVNMHHWPQTGQLCFPWLEVEQSLAFVQQSELELTYFM